MVKADADHIKGLCPAIAIEQKVITRTPRSTVGSMTEIYDYLRLLYARIGKTISPISGQEVKKDDVVDVLKAIRELELGAKVMVIVPFKQHANREVREELNILMQKGFSRIASPNPSKGVALEPFRIEDVLEMNDKDLKQVIHWDRSKQSTNNEQRSTYVLVDRIVVKDFDEDDIHRLSDSIGTAFYEGEGDVSLEVQSTDN